MVYRCANVFSHDWVQLGHVTMTRVIHVQNLKWLPSGISVLSVFSLKLWDFIPNCWNFITNIAGIWNVYVK